MYTTTNFKTKKALKTAIAEGQQIGVWDPGPFGKEITNGTVYLEGPHYPKPHSWYGKATIQNGVIVKVS